MTSSNELENNVELQHYYPLGRVAAAIDLLEGLWLDAASDAEREALNRVYETLFEADGVFRLRYKPRKKARGAK